MVVGEDIVVRPGMCYVEDWVRGTDFALFCFGEELGGRCSAFCWGRGL